MGSTTVLEYLDMAPVFDFDWTHELPTGLRTRLEALAAGRNEPLDAVIRTIAEWFVEAEDERAEQPLLDALVFYCENQLV